MTFNFERSPVVGQCLPGWHGQVALIDASQEVRSGDTVRVTIDYSDGRAASVVKVLEVDSSDRWWLTCNDGALQLGKFVVPRCVERVVGREASPIDLSHVPVHQPSEHTLEVAARRGAELRADQSFHGRRVGVPFPHTELTRPKVFSRTPETAHSTLPDSNDPLPSAPTNFSVTVVGNMVVADWENSATFPPRSQYELWSYPGSLSDVASKVLIWRGDASQKTLVYSTTSPQWLQVRASCGSAQASAFVPNTYGIGVQPVIAQVYSSAGWQFSVSPSALTKVGSTTQISAGPASGVIVNSAGSAVFSWTNPGSADIKISYPGSSSTTFVASGMALDEYRAGNFYCNVNDAGNVSSKYVAVQITRWNGV